MRDRTLLTILAMVVALVGARPYAGGWNDGSRLASVESLVDRGRFAIDDSIFVNVPPGLAPYEPGNTANQTGTLDKLFIDGLYFSDKSPVPSILLAAFYQLVNSLLGLSARQSPGLFCWLMTVASSGLAYVVAVRSLHRIASMFGLDRTAQLALVASFAVGTVALTYSRSVNNHIMLLGVMTSLLAEMVAGTAHIEETGALRLAIIGAIAGLGYTIDLGLGPILLLTTAIWLAIRFKSARACTLFAVGCVPWLVLHHSVNYMIAGTIGPANAKADYLNWPGSPFNSGNMTGHWQHPGVFRFITYSLELLLGPKGFMIHNQVLVLATLGMPFLWRRVRRERAELVWCAVVSCGTFFAYAATSNNYSGQCVSIRWFVPLLAPGFFCLALLLRERPAWFGDFLILGFFGLIWGIAAWVGGPWHKPPLLLLWILLACGQLGWLARRVRYESMTQVIICKLFASNHQRQKEIILSQQVGGQRLVDEAIPHESRRAHDTAIGIT
jgi:hypothetical protein